MQNVRSSDFDEAEESIFHAVEKAESKLIDAIKDEVETVFHALPHHEHETPTEVKHLHKGTQKSKPDPKVNVRMSVLEELLNGYME